MRRFPVGLTLAVSVAMAILVGLGAWQLYRLAWKERLLAQVEALKSEPASPLGLRLSSPGGLADAEYRRVVVACSASDRPRHDAFRYAVIDGQIRWRLLTLCHLPSGAFDSILIDRGVLSRFNGAMSPAATVVPPLATVTGVLRKPGGRPWLGPAETVSAHGARVFRVLDQAALLSLAADNGARRPAPYFIAAETETPAAPGVAPEALPRDIPNNHLTYALTWFALAGVLACVYGAMLYRRLTGR